ncbi:MAG: site-specific integrase [Bacteroidales bacterium]|jgi:integrase
MAITVTLLKRSVYGNREALYLDFYPEIPHPKTGKLTRREFLHLFLISEIETEVYDYIDKKGKDQKKIIPVLNKAGNPKIRKLSVWDKQHNKDTWEIAEKIRHRRDNELNKPLIYSELEKERLKTRIISTGSFLEFFKTLADKKRGSDKDNWNVVYKYLKDHTNGKLSFQDLDEIFCENFKKFLLNHNAFNGDNPISQNSACTYFVKFKAAVKQAYKDKKIVSNVSSGVSPIKLVEAQRNFLTLDELNKLVKTNCYDPMLKRAFLFSCLTGLRKSDITSLIWSELELIDKRYAIRFRQQKTKGIETLWISDQAFSLLGEPGKPEEKVFPGLKINSYYSKYLFLWLHEAGITKKISFHCARHTFATLQISQSTDLYTVSKMLGHKNIKTTAIYAKVIDKLKQDAADRIKLDL